MSDTKPTGGFAAAGASSVFKEPHDLAEALPLYEELQDHSAPPVPPKDASPAEVRAFIYQAVTSNGCVDETSARTIANKWRLGGGQELRDYPLTIWRDVFGPEESWLVYRSVRLLILKEEEPERLRKARIGIFVGKYGPYFFSFAALLCIVATGIAISKPSLWMLLFGFLAWAFGFSALFSHLFKPDSKLSEDELAAEMKNFSTTSSTTSSNGGAHANQGDQSSV